MCCFSYWYKYTVSRSRGYDGKRGGYVRSCIRKKQDAPSGVEEEGRVVLSGTLATLPLREAREAFEREYLLTQINRFGGNISRTAAFVGMERSALHRKLKSLGVVTGSKSGGRMAYVDEDHVQQAG